MIRVIMRAGRQADSLHYGQIVAVTSHAWHCTVAGDSSGEHKEQIPGTSSGVIIGSIKFNGPLTLRRRFTSTPASQLVAGLSEFIVIV